MILKTPYIFIKSNSTLPPKWLVVTIVSICAVLCGAQVWIGGSASVYGDSYSYFDAWEALKLIHPSEMRPPVYAIIVGVSREIFGVTGGLIFVLLLQWVCYAIALILLYRICRRIDIGERISSLVVIGVLLLPGMWVLNNLAIPESLCGSMIVLLVWFSIRYVDSRETRWLWFSGLLLGALVFTKPVFVSLIPIMIVFWIIAGRRNVKQIKIAMGMVGIILCALLFYAWQIARFNNGIYALTRTADDNLFYCLREDGIIRPDEISVDSIRERFAPFYAQDAGQHAPGENLYTEEMLEFSWQEKKYMAQIALKNHPKEAIAGTWTRFEESAFFSQTLYPETHELPIYQSNIVTPKGRIPFFFPFNRWLHTPIWFSWILLLTYFGGAIAAWRRRKHLPLIRLLIGAILFTGMFVSIVGAQDSWGRLFTPFNLLLVPVSGYLLQKIAQYFQLSVSSLARKVKS